MAGDKDETVVEAPPPKAGDQPQLSVTMKGGAKEVINQLNGEQKPSSDPKAIPPGMKGEGDYTIEGFVLALTNPNYVVRAKRQAPRKDDLGQSLLGEVYRTECPVTLQDIKDDIEKESGGKVYRVTVEDSRNGKLMGALRLEIDKDPILPFRMDALPLNAHERKSPWGLPIGAPDPEIAKIDREIQIAERDEDLAKRQIRLENLRGGSRQGSDPEVAALKQQIVMMRERELDAKQREIERLTALAAAPKAPAGESESTKMLTQLMVEMREDRKAANERFERMIAKQEADKSEAILRELKELRSAPTKSDEDFIEKLIKFKKAMALLEKDDDGDDEEPKEWWEILIKDGIPQLVDLIKDKKKEGKSMTREELLAEMDKEADIAVRKAAERNAGANLPLATRPAALPAPVAPPQPVHQGQMVVPPPVVVQNPALPQPVAAPQVPPPVAAVVAPPVVAAPEAVPPPAAPPQIAMPKTVEQEISERVGAVFVIIEREATIRPRDYQWNAIAWDTLPEAFMETLVMVAEPAGMPAVFANVASPQMVEQMTALLSQPKASAFVKQGLDELKEWVAKVKEDPNFDPFAEDEELPE